MQDVTYYFGAGASFHTLPVVKQIPERILIAIEIIKKFDDDFNKDEPVEANFKTTKSAAFKNLIDDLYWLHEKSNTHASVDTYAKKLYLAQKFDEFDKLKIILSIYLTIEQIINKPDFRYDYFYAAILNINLQDFPSNIKIISWNYDLQFELSYEMFCDRLNDFSFSRAYSTLNVISKHNSKELLKDKFSIFKINGSAIYFEGLGFKNYTFGLNTSFELGLDSMSNIVKSYAALKEFDRELTCQLSFAWEEDFAQKNDKPGIIEKTINWVDTTKVLVVIGYSFPFFNRVIDTEILNGMPYLEKVYFQSPTADEMIERFRAIRPDIKKENLIPIKDLNEFYLPNELTF